LEEEIEKQGDRNREKKQRRNRREEEEPPQQPPSLRRDHIATEGHQHCQCRQQASLPSPSSSTFIFPRLHCSRCM